MRIGMVLQKGYPPDIRVEKEARALQAAGHQVYLLAKSRKSYDEPAEENVNGLPVRRVPPVQDELRWLARKWNSTRFHLFFLDPYWAGQIEDYVDGYSLEALHVHDLPLVGTAIAVGKAMSIPVVADLHEDYPAAVQVWQSAKRSLKHKVFGDLARWRAYETRCVREADHIVVVLDEAKERIQQSGIDARKVTVVMNVEDVAYFTSDGCNAALISQCREAADFVVSYIGGFAAHRGLDTAVEAMVYARERLPSCRLLLVGAQESGEYVQSLRELVKKNELERFVEILGWQPFENVPCYIAASDVCLVPHHRTTHTDYAIPHKLFQYMLMAKPVIVSDCVALERIVQEARNGLVFQAGNPRDLADKIEHLYRDADFRETCGQRGRQAVLDRYNWETESKKLLELYRRLS